MIDNDVTDPSELAAANEILEMIKEFIANTKFAPPSDAQGNIIDKKY